ncbi:MAG: tRNA 2-selenouridine(34) synthase MnmH, partial [Bacteroidota bacterium]
GGYKSYRQYIRQAFTRQSKIIILGGSTGSSKTEILHQLKIQGEQILDLEKFANHKGSVFGSLGQEVQPTNEQFENELYEDWSGFDPEKHLWIEDESRSIGLVKIPDPLFSQMNLSPMIQIDMNKEERINRLVKEYALFQSTELKNAFEKIAEKLGGARLALALSAIDQADFSTAANLALAHYDKSYQYAISKRLNREIHEINLEKDAPAENALILKEIAKNLDTKNYDSNH